MPSQEPQDRKELQVDQWAKEMQGFTTKLGNYLESQRVENMQAHMINHVHIRKVEQKVDEIGEVMGCLTGGILILLVILFLILIFR